MASSLSPQLRLWWQASRPAFYIATLVPLTLGWLQAAKDTGAYRPLLFSLIVLCGFFLHLAANLGNDVFDRLSGVDREDTIGGSGTFREGGLTLRQYVIALCLLHAATFGLGWLGVVMTGLREIWFFVLFGMFASFFYVAPPLRLGYRALGEVLVFCSMGLVMTTGTYFTLAGRWSNAALALSLPVGLMVAGILYYQSLPEIATDKAAGKRTLAGLLGPQRAILAFRLWWPAVWVLMLLLIPAGICSWLVLPGIALSLPLYLKTVDHLCHAGNDWTPLDAHGHLVRKMYLLCGLSMICAVLF